MSEPDDLVPVSVRRGEVVPPEDPEDWTRPLTWVAAAGMLAAPAVALAWFAIAPPTGSAPAAGTWLVALALAVGAAGAGATQRGRLRAFAGTLAAALFAALATVIVAGATAGEPQVAVAAPPLAHAVVAALAGLGGAAVAAIVAGLSAGLPAPAARAAVLAPLAAAVAAILVPVVGGR